jgi:hypothetical protein
MSDPLATAILLTLHYADLFDYAMTREEVVRFLIGVGTTRREIDRALDDPTRLNGHVLRLDGLLALPQRHALIAERARWHAAAQQQLPRARQYARLLAHLPFVRMVALTGGLAMENARDRDIDLFIITAPGRLWLVRGTAVALVRLARLRGDLLCPNFLVTENALKIPDENLYTAHEIVQMVPLYGMETYREFRRVNQWANKYLPNADASIAQVDARPLSGIGMRLKRAAERALSGATGDRIERWEMTRKIAKLTAQISTGADAVAFSSDVCRGFFSGHARRVLDEFDSRLALLRAEAILPAREPAPQG